MSNPATASSTAYARAINLLVQASRVSPPLRQAVAAVEAEVDRLTSENAALRDAGERLSAKVRRVDAVAAKWSDDPPVAYWGHRLRDNIDPPGADTAFDCLARWDALTAPSAHQANQH